LERLPKNLVYSIYSRGRMIWSHWARLNKIILTGDFNLVTFTNWAIWNDVILAVITLSDFHCSSPVVGTDEKVIGFLSTDKNANGRRFPIELVGFVVGLSLVRRNKPQMAYRWHQLLIDENMWKARPLWWCEWSFYLFIKWSTFLELCQ